MALSLVFVEVCDANLACREELFELENENPSVSVMETECMSQCELCALHPYVFINGDLLYTDSPDSLIQQAKDKVHEILSDMNKDS